MNSKFKIVIFVSLGSPRNNHQDRNKSVRDLLGQMPVKEEAARKQEDKARDIDHVSGLTQMKREMKED